MLNILRNPPAVFQSSCPAFPPPMYDVRPYQWLHALASAAFLLRATLVGVKWYLIVMLVIGVIFEDFFVGGP